MWTIARVKVTIDDHLYQEAEVDPSEAQFEKSSYVPDGKVFAFYSVVQ